MNVTLPCNHCHSIFNSTLEKAATAVTCPGCQAQFPVDAEVLRDGKLSGCALCHGELYVRKDFSQPIGVAIVVVGFAISLVTYYYHWIFVTYGVLFGVALLDALMYFLVGNMLQCYRCQAQYRQVPGLEEHAPFNLETHERYRQQAARLSQSASSSQS